MEKRLVLVLEDDAFSGSERGRNVSTLKTKHMPAFQEAELVLYLLPSGGVRVLKSKNQLYRIEYRSG